MFTFSYFTRRYVALIVFFFILFVVILNTSLFSFKGKEWTNNVDTSGEMILARLSRAMAELSALKTQNEELRVLIKSYIPFDPNANKLTNHNNIPINEDKSQAISQPTDLNKEFELTRRKLARDVKELWNYVSKSLNADQNGFVKELKNSLLYDIDSLLKREASARRKGLVDLSDYIQQSVSSLQNPEDCSTARKLVCNLNKGCGFGCQIHHVTYCFIVSIATSRTLILNSKNWRYVNSKASKSRTSKSLWDAAFKPLSNSCLDDSGSSRGNWATSLDNEDLQVLDLPIIDSLKPKPNFLPLSIPEDISEKLITLHGDPIVWFIGQILKFVLRPSEEMEKFLMDSKRKLGFTNSMPIVGLHVRRTDKINTEAAYHSLAEYMQHVEDYYDRLDLYNRRMNKNTKLKRIIYLATDDVNVWKKEVPKFEEKGFIFIGDSSISNSASVGKRYSFESLKNVILDVTLLSESDYLVCTFSSQVCRLAYEIMQFKRPDQDRSSDFYSLDDIYYFGGQSSHNQLAILNHEPASDKEISLSFGDVVGIAGNHWNGFNKGYNRNTKETGLYPGYKTIDMIDTAKFKLFESTE